MIWSKGTINLPTRIIANEFEKLKNEISSANVDLNFSYKYGEHSIEFENVLACCYELDENASPTIYRLKYLDRIFPNLNHKVSEIKTITETGIYTLVTSEELIVVNGIVASPYAV